MDDLELMERAVKLDTYGKKMMILLMQESLAKDAALEKESDENLDRFLEMGKHGHALKGKPTISGLLDEFISYNSGKEFQREHVVLTLHHQALCGGLTATKQEVSKRLTKLLREKGIVSRRDCNLHYWSMP